MECSLGRACWEEICLVMARLGRPNGPSKRRSNSVLDRTVLYREDWALVGAWEGGGDWGSWVSSSRPGKLCLLVFLVCRGPSARLFASIECRPNRLGFLSECRLCRDFSLMLLISWPAPRSAGELGSTSSEYGCSCCPMVDHRRASQRLVVSRVWEEEEEVVVLITGTDIKTKRGPGIQ